MILAKTTVYGHRKESLQLGLDIGQKLNETFVVYLEFINLDTES